MRIYRLRCRDTIEERLETTLHDKVDLFNAAVEELAVEPVWVMERARRAVGTNWLLSTCG